MKMLQPPATFEEFLKTQNLGEWPDNPLMDDTISLLLKLGHDYTSEALNEYFYKNAPLKQEIITDLEMKINENVSLLEKYFLQTLNPESQIGKSKDAASRMKKTGKEICAFKQVKRREQVEDCTFPGFKKEKLTDLPGNLEGPHVLNYVTKAQNFKAKFLRMWKTWFFSEASVAILQDSFWWFFLEKFKPNQEDQDHLFDRIADSFVALFGSVHYDVKDFFFKVYADCLSQAICAVFWGAFPKSHVIFNDKFKEELINLIFQWVSGIKPVPSSWKKWTLDFNGMIDISQINEILSIEQAGRNQLDFNLDKLIQDAKDTCLSRLLDEEIKDIRSTMDTSSKSATIIESHSIGPGPRFCRVLFKLGGQSPLVCHYLKMHAITNVITNTLTHKLQRTEISRLPSVAPTYQDVIKEAERVRKNVHTGYNILRDKTKKEISEIEHKLQVDMQIERNVFNKEPTMIPEAVDKDMEEFL
uniref:Protein FAM227B isoform X3 n=1 Tax=Geotrypetes seraphini TaxID=260995 RepID=A0A6P8PKK2_GEOSA|nr:protein FAM227B isoform X3 [Geotrypetes seraphini]